MLHRDLSRSAIIAFATHGLQPGEAAWPLQNPPACMTLVPGGDESPLSPLSGVRPQATLIGWYSRPNTAGADARSS